MKQKIIFKSLTIAFIMLTIHSAVFSQILITEDSGGGTNDESAILQIDSDTKGVLIPRISTENRLLISAVEGLLVYDTDEASFYFYGGSGWINLSSPSPEIWTKNASNVYLTNLDDNVGIGTTPTSSKFVVRANNGSLPDAVLFEVKDETGNPVFVVTSEGVRIYVKDKAKGVSGGFAVGQYGSLKADGDEFFSVTPFQTRVNTLPNGKAISGGFAVGQYSSLKGGTLHHNFSTNPVETRIYTGGTQTPVVKGEKAVSSGFAVGQYGSLKAAGDDYMHMTPDNYFIGHEAGLNITPNIPIVDVDGIHNIFVGYQSGFQNTSGHENTYVGHLSGENQKLGTDNVFLGNAAGQGLTTYTGTSLRNVVLGAGAGNLLDDAIDNVFIGHLAGEGLGSGSAGIDGDFNVIIGEQAGRSLTEGDRNVYIGKESGFSSTSGDNNVFIGNTTGYSAEAINASVFIGLQAGYSQSTDHGNIYIGNSTGMYMGSGGSNVFLGTNTAWNQGSGADNVIIGAGAATMIYENGTHTGSNNVVLGADAGDALNGDSNIFIGSGAGGAYAGSNRLYIENSNMATPLIYGQFDTDLVGINSAAPTANLHIKQVGAGEEGFAIENDDNNNTWSWEISSSFLRLYYNNGEVGYWDNSTGNYNASSDKRLKKDIVYMDKDILNRIMKLRPATYRLLHTEKSGNKNIGFIAQEVQKYFPELVYQEDENDFLSLHYPDFGVIAIKAIQEQQIQIKLQDVENKKQTSEIEDLKKQIQELKELIQSK